MSTVRNKRGFTLIELLVVMSIVSVLTSFILVSLNSARNKGRDGAMWNYMIQFRNIVELDRGDSQPYINLQRDWINNGLGSTCEQSFYVGPYAQKAVQICNEVVKLLEQTGVADHFMKTQPNTASNPDYFSIMLGLPSGGVTDGHPNKFICTGSSGRTSSDVPYNSWTSPGCADNP